MSSKHHLRNFKRESQSINCKNFTVHLHNLWNPVSKEFKNDEPGAIKADPHTHIRYTTYSWKYPFLISGLFLFLFPLNLLFLEGKVKGSQLKNERQKEDNKNSMQITLFPHHILLNILFSFLYWPLHAITPSQDWCDLTSTSKYINCYYITAKRKWINL